MAPPKNRDTHKKFHDAIFRSNFGLFSHSFHDLRIRNFGEISAFHFSSKTVFYTLSYGQPPSFFLLYIYWQITYILLCAFKTFKYLQLSPRLYALWETMYEARIDMASCILFDMGSSFIICYFRSYCCEITVRELSHNWVPQKWSRLWEIDSQK